MTSAMSSSAITTVLTSGTATSPATGSLMAGSMLSSGFSLANVPNLSQFVTTKLSRDNYILWKTQVIPVLRGANLMGFVDGSYKCPAEFVSASTEEDAALVVNPEYALWNRQDQALMAGILSTLSIEVLAQVTLLDSSRAVWMTLASMFSTATNSKVMQIRVQLANLQKGEMSMPVYFQKVKGLTDAMAAIGKPLGDEEIIAYILAGLDESYDSLVDALSARTDVPKLSEVYALFMGRDVRSETRSSASQLNLGGSANFSARGGRGAQGRNGGGRGNFNRGGGGGGRGQGSQGGRGNGGRYNGGNNGGYNNSSGHNSGGGNGGGYGYHHNSGGRPTCQICGRPGHSALKCYDRFDHSIQPEDPRVANYTNGNSSYQVDTNWYSDTGATDHITGDLDRLSVREKYNGKERIQTANGSGSSHEEGASSRNV